MLKPRPGRSGYRSDAGRGDRRPRRTVSPRTAEAVSVSDSVAGPRLRPGVLDALALPEHGVDEQLARLVGGSHHRSRCAVQEVEFLLGDVTPRLVLVGVDVGLDREV